MRRELSLICAASVLAAGCGNQRSEPPDVTTPVRPAGSSPAFFDAQGVRIDVPGGWKVRTADTPPLVATVQSGTASVAVWRYPRTEKLPRTKAQLAQARDLLLAAARARDSTFKEGKAEITKSGRHPAIAVRGTETVSGQARTVRSLHVFAFGAEVVVDAFAPPADFSRVDREAFRPLMRSVRVRAPKK
jgi:hypothetical protein